MLYEKEKITTRDLTADGLRAYQIDRQIYHDELARYRQQEEAVTFMKTWILNSVSVKWRSTACLPTESLRTWYTKLKEQVGISDARLNSNIREEYRKVVNTRGDRVSSWDTWIGEWERIINEAREKGVPEAVDASSWFDDFLRAVSPRHEHWATSYEASSGTQVLQGSTSFREVANKFRDYLKRSNGSAGRPPRTAKGAFVALGAAEDSEAEEQKEDRQQHGGKRSAPKTNNRRDHRGGDRNKKQRTDESGGYRGPLTCFGCGSFHRLTDCSYAFPNKLLQVGCPARTSWSDTRKSCAEHQAPGAGKKDGDLEEARGG